MNDKGFSYIELLCVLGITGTIAGTIAMQCINAKDKAIDMTDKYIATYEQIETQITEDTNDGNIEELF